jgi:hypothetical protein
VRGAASATVIADNTTIDTAANTIAKLLLAPAQRSLLLAITCKTPVFLFSSDIYRLSVPVKRKPKRKSSVFVFFFFGEKNTQW